MPALSYHQVQLTPRYSELPSRALADVSVALGKHTFKLPVVPANMLTVINAPLARDLSEGGYFYIYHRFGTTGDSKQPETLDLVRLANREKWKTISISTGVNDDSIQILRAIKEEGLRVDFICIDVAHAHHAKTRERLEYLKTNHPDIFRMAGNVATAEAVSDLYSWGAQAVKCGIGTGSICTTRLQTGFSIPAFTCILQCGAEAKKIRKAGGDISLIADGGIKNIGDIAKAICAGADLAMSGGLFANCVDSPAEILNGKKAYFGSTSFQAKKENRHSEGQLLEIEASGTYAERLTDIQQALQSSVSYSGGQDLSALRDVEWIEIKD